MKLRPRSREICAGHVYPINERCRTCKVDDWNLCCEDYEPHTTHTVYRFEVVGDSDDLREADFATD